MKSVMKSKPYISMKKQIMAEQAENVAVVCKAASR